MPVDLCIAAVDTATWRRFYPQTATERFALKITIAPLAIRLFKATASTVASLKIVYSSDSTYLARQ